MKPESVPGTQKKPRLLLLTRNLPPLIGGMERFNARVIEQLAKHYEMAICGPRGCARHLVGASKVVEVPVRPLAFFFLGMLFSGLRLAGSFRPDVVIAGSGLTAPMAKLCALRARAPALVFLYGLDLVVSSRIYQKLWMRAIRACDGFLPISQHTRQLAIKCGADASRMRIVTPGVDPALAHDHEATVFRASHGLKDRRLLVSVGRLTRRKGLVEFIDQCLPSIIAQCPDVILVVIGGEAADALSGASDGAMAQMREVAVARGMENHIMLLGSVSDATVQAAYAASCAHVFPVREIPGDVEGFGIVALEAAMLGVPTVAFAVGGVPDAVSEGVSGNLIESGDYAAMARALLSYLEESSQAATLKPARIEFARGFEWDRIGERLHRAVMELAHL